MARIIAGVGASHSPSIAFAYDQRQENTAAWRPFFDSAASLRVRLAESRPDVMIFIYNDHFWQFDLDIVPTFAIGVANSYELAPERQTSRPLPSPTGDPAFSWHIVRSLIGEEFDLTVCQRMMLDHGFFSVMPLLCDPPWDVRIIPVAVNVIQHPLPTPARCWKLGQAIARAVRSYAKDERVVVVSTGGLSHQLHGANFGYTNPHWDRNFLHLLVEDPQQLIALNHDDYMQRGGAESVEMIVWLAMRAALDHPQVRQCSYHSGLLTGLGLLHLEEGA